MNNTKYGNKREKKQAANLKEAKSISLMKQTQDRNLKGPVI